MRSSYPQSSGPSQQPSPPPRGISTFTPYVPAPYDMPSSSSSSPMTHHSQQFGATPYLDQSPSQHDHSPRDHIPPQDQHYLGSYAVSVPEHEVSASFTGYTNGFSHVSPRYLPGAGESLSHMNPQIITTTASQASVLASPDAGQYHRMNMTPRPGDIQDLSGPSMMNMGHPNHVNYQQQTPQSSRSKRGGGKPVHKIPSKKAANRRPVHQPSSRTSVVASQQNNDDEETGVLTLSDKCEDDLRFIFDTRNQLVEMGMKGKGMWEEICNKYENQYGQHLDKPALQMRHARCVTKYGIWPEREVSCQHCKSLSNSSVSTLFHLVTLLWLAHT